ncbi:MAG: glycerophosphodiester phosphodiesterase family protein [Clostridia bacterium]
MNIYDTWLVNKQIAHRGLHDEVSPENTPSAFEKAINNDYAIEMDLQMTLDGVVVVFHDDNMKRLTGLDKDIRQTLFKDIKDLSILKSQEKISTFDDFLKQINGRTPLLIEVKSHANIGIMEQKILNYLSTYKGEFALQSFNPFIVKWFAINAPQYIRGQLSSRFKGERTLNALKRYLLRNLFFIKSNKSQFVSYDIDGLPSRLVTRVKKRMPVLAWTVHSQQEITQKHLSFDNIIFENFIPASKQKN